MEGRFGHASVVRCGLGGGCAVDFEGVFVGFGADMGVDFAFYEA